MQNTFKAVLRDASGSVVIHKDIVLAVVSPPHLGENQDLLLLSSHESRYTYAGRSTRERHPATGIDRDSGSSNKSTAPPGVAAYQSESIDIEVPAQVARQASVGHPRVYKGKGRSDGVEPKKTDHIWVV